MRRIDSFYKNNGYQRRTVNYDNWANSVALFGDSTTYGQGLEDKDRIHNKLLTDFPVNNFGYPAWSNDHIFKRFLEEINEHGFPRAVIIGWSSPFRMLTVDETLKEYVSISSWTPTENNTKIWETAAAKLCTEAPMTMMSRTDDITQAVRLICKDRTILKEWTVFHPGHFYSGPKVSSFWGDYNEEDVYSLKFEDRASDNIHPGPKSIETLCNYLGRI